MVTASHSGRLHIVATPIGNLADISFRAVDTLRSVDLIAAEDTRHSKHLLQHYGVTTPLVSLHEHNEQQRSEMLLQRLLAGESVALISDAGTPLISDPGYRLVKLVRERGVAVVPIPGSCALIAALSASGMPAERFAFEGFLPPKQGARRQVLQQLAGETRTLIFYESPRRLAATLADMCALWGGARLGCLARELTKLHETIETRSLQSLYDWVAADENQQRGECVLLVEGAPADVARDEQELEKVLVLLLPELSVSKAAAIAAELTGSSRNRAYQLALKLQQES